MPSVRVSRLCSLRQREVIQSSRPLRHAKRPPQRRKGMLPSPATASTQLDRPCMAEQDSGPAHPHTIRKRKLRMSLCSRETRTPSTPVKISRRRLHADLHYLRGGNFGFRLHRPSAQANHCDVYRGKVGTNLYRRRRHDMHYQDSPPRMNENVCAYQRLTSSKGFFGTEILEDNVSKADDGESLDSGHFPGSQKVLHSGSKEMLLNHTSIVLPCFEGLAISRHMLQVLRLRKKKHNLPDAVSYKNLYNRPSNAILDDLNANDVSHGNAFYSQRNSCGPGEHMKHLTASIDDESQCSLSSEQSSLFLYDGIFYQTPKRRVPVNAPRRSSKLETCKNPPAYPIEIPHTQRPSRRSNASLCHKRKVKSHNSRDFATLASQERSEQPDRFSPPNSFEVGNLTSNSKGRSVGNLEQFAVRESAGTTKGIKKCVQIAENINSMVANTLNALYQQGEQTKEAHEYTLEIDHDLSAVLDFHFLKKHFNKEGVTDFDNEAIAAGVQGEKILGSLGGLFGKTWKPVKRRAINGPRDNNPRRSVSDEKSNLGLLNSGRACLKSHPGKSYSESPTQVQLPWQAKVKIEGREQDDALTDLSNVVSELKKMSLDMANELSRQTEALDPFQDEVVELSQRLKRANLRGRLLLA